MSTVGNQLLIADQFLTAQPSTVDYNIILANKLPSQATTNTTYMSIDPQTEGPKCKLAASEHC